EKPVVPLHRLVGPCTLEAARERVGTVATVDGVLPSETLRLDGSCLWFGTDVLGIYSAVGLANRVAADDERNGLLVVHRHAPEGLTNVPRGRERIRIAVGPLGVYVDQPHLHRSEGIGELPVTAVALVCQPCVLGTPEDLLGLPDVLS